MPGGPILLAGTAWKGEPLVFYEHVGRAGKPVGEKIEKLTFVDIGRCIGQLVEDRNQTYGDSVPRAAAILHVLYPNGVSVEQYADMLLVVRILDKLSRIATGALKDSYEDIAGYGLLGVRARGGK